MIKYTPARPSYILVVPNQTPERKGLTRELREFDQMPPSLKTLGKPKPQVAHEVLMALASPEDSELQEVFSCVAPVFDTFKPVSSLPADPSSYRFPLSEYCWRIQSQFTKLLCCSSARHRERLGTYQKRPIRVYWVERPRQTGTVHVESQAQERLRFLSASLPWRDCGITARGFQEVQ